MDFLPTVQQIININNLPSGVPFYAELLPGGVSSDIWLVYAGEYRYVFKQALPILKVADHWTADVKRNLTEQKFIRFISSIFPEAVPKIYTAGEVRPYFLMEYLGPPFQNWKTLLLKGIFDPIYTERASLLLAGIHRLNWDNQDVKEHFDTPENFYALRLEPYFVSIANRYPHLHSLIMNEVRRLQSEKYTLVHGDYSPKNILVSDDRLVLLDHEVAHYGDPAFDVAFLTNHLILKFIHQGANRGILPDLAQIAWDTYFRNMTLDPGLPERSSRLLWLMMLARLDGKSPVEYLDENMKSHLRSFLLKEIKRTHLGDFKEMKRRLLNY